MAEHQNQNVLVAPNSGEAREERYIVLQDDVKLFAPTRVARSSR